MVRKVIVVPHDPGWKLLFQIEADWLRNFIGDVITKIHHFGSTSIPGIYAKPIIDMLIEVNDINYIDNKNDQFQILGYLPKGEFGITGRRFIIKGDEENRSHHLHFYPINHPEILRHLDFRDYMIAHPQEAQAYSELKIRLAQLYPTDIDSYNKGKTDFICEIDRKAKIWRNRS